MSASSHRSTRIVLGLAFIAGALVILYFSSSPALRCTRVDGRVDCEVTANALNLFAVNEARVGNVRSVVVVSGNIGTTSSRRTAFLYFRTDAGDVDLGYFSQRFLTNAGELDTFVRESAAPEIRLETGVTFRNMTAYVAVAFMLLVGLTALVASAPGRRPGRSVYDSPIM